MKFKKGLGTQLLARLLIPIVVFLSIVGVPALPIAGTPVSTVQADDSYTVEVKFNPTGTHVDKEGRLNIRLDVYYGEGSKTYDQQHIQVPIIPEGGYPGKVDLEGNPVDREAYELWLDSLPKEWRLNPALCHFITVPASVTLEDLENYIRSVFGEDTLATLDNVLILPDSRDYVSPLMRDIGKFSDEVVSAKDAVALVSSVNDLFTNLVVPLDGDSKAFFVEPESIITGNAVIDRTNALTITVTYVDRMGPADGDGTLDTWEMWLTNNDGVNVEVATFYPPDPGVSANLSTRDVETIGAVTKGSKQTFTGKSTTVLTGDLAGIYGTAGDIERTADSGTDLLWWKAGDNIPCTNKEFQSTNWSLISLRATGNGGVSAPTVVTNAATSVEETTATLSGNITALGNSANCVARRFQWGTNTGVYTANWTETGSFGIGNFTHGLTGLTKGEGYFYVASANNTGNTTWGVGSEVFFITKPDPATSFTSTGNGTTWISLSWTNGTGMDYAEIRYNTGSAPADNVTGSAGYWGVGTTANISGLSSGTTYFFTIFTHATENSQWSTADNNPSCQDTTDSIPAINSPSVTTNAASLVEETTATLNGEITNTGGADCDMRGFDYDIDTGAPYANESTANGTFGTGAYTANLTSLTKGELYFFRAKAHNTGNATTGYGSELTFLTKPDPATSFGSTGNGTTWISCNWTNGDGMDYVSIRYSATSYPADNTSGTHGHWGNGTTANISGLDPNETYYFSIFTYATEGGLWSTADTYDTFSDTTDVGLPTVTTSAATGVTDNDATLNGTITDDGGASCNVTWYWATTDYGATDNWTNTANQTGQSAGAVSYVITDNLTASTLYYFITKVINEAGIGWGSSVNFTTLSETLGPPTNLTLTDLGAITVSANWAPGMAATYTMLRASRTAYPESPAEGELIYYGPATSVNITGVNLDIMEVFVSGWGYDSDNSTYSGNVTTASIGGEGMEELAIQVGGLGDAVIEAIEALATSIIADKFLTLLIISVISALAFWQRNLFLYLLAVPVNMVYGLSLATESDTGSSLWVAGVIIAIIGTYCLFKVVMIGLKITRERGSNEQE